MRSIFTVFMLSVMIAASTVMSLKAQELPSNGPALEEFIKNYILENPQVLIEALETFERQQEAEQLARQREMLGRSSAVLTQSEHQVILGNPDGDVTLIEFFDYNCGFCRRTLPDVDRLVEEDPNLKIVLKEFPVLGEGSVEAARVAIAASKIDTEKYLELHRELLSARGQVDRRTAMLLSERLGYDREELEQMLDTGPINEAINEVYSIATNLGLSGTPTFIIGEEILPGAVGYDVLKDKIDSMRRCGETVCS